MCVVDGLIVVLGQSKGGDVQLRIFGDEFYSRYETLDGYTVLYDVDIGLYAYATLANGHLVSSGVPIGKPLPAGLRRHLKDDPSVRNERFGLRYDRLRPQEDLSGPSVARTMGPDNGLLSGRKLHSGSIRGLTILVDFDDVRTNITRDAVDRMFNGTNYDEHGNFCSVREYFELVSTGKLDYTNQVVGPVRLSKRRSHYINNLLLEEALDLAIQHHQIDLSDFDSRGEGIVDAINLLYAGESQYTGDIWPHNSVETLHYGPMRTHYYQITGLGTHPVDLRIGTICHENGHLLCRFPDMYDYGKRDGDNEKSQGIGYFCLMGSGNHLNDKRTPAPVCGYLRELAGWTDTTVLLNGAGSHVATHADYSVVMKYELDLANEYFVVENRTKLGLDAHLPDSGLAVYHCDRLGSNEWQEGTRNHHYQCALIQADGHLDLENNRNRGDAGDLFSDIAGVALAHDTTPDSRRWDGSDSGLRISDVAAPGAAIGFTIGNSQVRPTAEGISARNLVIPDADPNGVEDEIVIDATGTLTKIELHFEIFHTWIGDLEVTLIAPDDTEVPVHRNEGGNTRDLIETLTDEDHTGLAGLAGTSINGSWRLKVVDEVRRDVGRLALWSLHLDYERGATLEGSVQPSTAIPDRNATGVTSVITLMGEGVVDEIEAARTPRVRPARSVPRRRGSSPARRCEPSPRPLRSRRARAACGSGTTDRRRTRSRCLRLRPRPASGRR